LRGVTIISESDIKLIYTNLTVLIDSTII